MTRRRRSTAAGPGAARRRSWHGPRPTHRTGSESRAGPQRAERPSRCQYQSRPTVTVTITETVTVAGPPLAGPGPCRDSDRRRLPGDLSRSLSAVQCTSSGSLCSGPGPGGPSRARRADSSSSSVLTPSPGPPQPEAAGRSELRLTRSLCHGAAWALSRSGPGSRFRVKNLRLRVSLRPVGPGGRAAQDSAKSARPSSE